MTAINIQYPISRSQSDILILRLPCYDWLDFIPCIDCRSTSGGHISEIFTTGTNVETINQQFLIKERMDYFLFMLMKAL